MKLTKCNNIEELKRNQELKKSEIIYNEITKLRKQIDKQYLMVLKGKQNREKICNLSNSIDELINQYNKTLKEEGK